MPRLKYQSPAAAAARLGVSRQLVMRWLAAGRIAGAKSELDQLGRTVWLVPTTAKRPQKIPPGRKPQAAE